MDTTTNDLPSNSALLNQTNNLNEQLLEAIRRGDATAITTLLADPDILINQVDTNGWTALMWAASRGHTATVTALLAISCIEVNHANNKGETALMWAARCGHTATVAELLTAPGILVNQANNNGETALMLASFNNHLTTVAKLLTAPRILVNQADNNGMTALMLATSWKDTATFAALLAVPDILVNLANNKGETPLMLATRYGHMNIVSALIKKGVDFLAVNNNGKTALMLATAKYCRDSSYNKIVTTLRDASLAQLRQRWGNMSDVLNMMPSALVPIIAGYDIPPGLCENPKQEQEIQRTLLKFFNEKTRAAQTTGEAMEIEPEQVASTAPTNRHPNKRRTRSFTRD